MKNSLRVVIDTNVLVSASLLSNSTPRRAFERALQIGQLLASRESFIEICDVLRRKKFDRYITTEQREAFLGQIYLLAEIVIPQETIRVCRDPDDDRFLELAVGGAAQFLVTGDPDLLILHPFRNIAIVTPADFLALTDEPADNS